PSALRWGTRSSRRRRTSIPAVTSRCATAATCWPRTPEERRRSHGPDALMRPAPSSPCRRAPRAEAEALRPGLARPQHLADGLRRDQAHQAAACFHHAYGRGRFFLQQPEGVLEAATVADGRNVALHHLADDALRSVLLERLDHGVAAQQADEAP